jgi:hypothetical protein
MEYEPSDMYFTGQSERRRVTHILPGGQFGIERGFIVMSLAVADA